jgi:hypothetical protein
MISAHNRNSIKAKYLSTFEIQSKPLLIYFKYPHVKEIMYIFSIQQFWWRYFDI